MEVLTAPQSRKKRKKRKDDVTLPEGQDDEESYTDKLTKWSGSTVDALTQVNKHSTMSLASACVL